MAQPYQQDIVDTISVTPRSGIPAEPVHEVRSGVVAQVVITPGVLVVPGTTDIQVKLPTSAADVAKGLGVSLLLQLGYELTDDYAIGRNVSYVADGAMWVAVEQAVTRGNQCFARYAAGAGGTQLGAFRADVDTASAAAVPACRYDSSTVGAGFAKVRVDLPATA